MDARPSLRPIRRRSSWLDQRLALVGRAVSTFEAFRVEARDPKF
jgi:hypothetical protein